MIVIVIVVVVVVTMVVIVVVIMVSMSIVIVVAIRTMNVTMIVSMSVIVPVSMIAIGTMGVLLLLCETGCKFSEVRYRRTFEASILTNGVNDIDIHGDDGIVRGGSAGKGESGSSEVVKVGPSEFRGTSLDGDFGIDGRVAEEHGKRLENGGEELFREEGHEVDERVGYAQL